MNQNVARRPRFTRVANLPALRLTDRDKAILSGVSKYRFLTTSHILSLVSGSRQNIVRRLQRLYHAGFLDRPRAQLPLRLTGELSEFVYSPTRKTLSHLAPCAGSTVSGSESRAVSSLFLAHSLMITDALLRIESSCASSGVVFISENDILDGAPPVETAGHLQWRVTLQDGSSKLTVGVIPDAAFAIELQTGIGIRRLYFFLEADRGTMPIYRSSLRLSSIRRKALAYLRSRRSRVPQNRFGIAGFQVLFVGRSHERLERMKEMCDSVAEERASSLFLFASSDELQRSVNPIAMIVNAAHRRHTTGMGDGVI